MLALRLMTERENARLLRGGGRLERIATETPHACSRQRFQAGSRPAAGAAAQACLAQPWHADFENASTEHP
jgi:hypothetical protein